MAGMDGWGWMSGIWVWRDPPHLRSNPVSYTTVAPVTTPNHRHCDRRNERGAMHSSACMRCHRRKVRCDKVVPTCTPCMRANSPCEYVASENQLRKRNTQRLERRIRDLEAQNEALMGKIRQGGSHNEERLRSESPRTPRLASSSRPKNADGPGSSAVTDQVMHMSLIAGGSDHFVGSASGIFLANLIQNFESPSTASPTASTTDWNSNQRVRSQSPGAAPPLPTESHGRNLMQAYLNHDHICYPFLSIDKLQQSFQALHDASAVATSSESFFIDMVFAIGTSQFHKYNWNRVYDAEAHYNRAFLKLGDVMAQGGIQALQAILLVCQYRMGSTPRNATASVWHLIGIASRMCLEMGLHRAATYTPPSNRRSADDMLEAMSIKKNCFWSLVSIDRVASIALGRPLAVQLEDVDVDLPNGEALPFEQPADHSMQGNPSEIPSGASSSERSALFAHIVAYRVLCGRILNTLYRSPKATATDGVGDSASARDRLFQELQVWSQGASSLPTVTGVAASSFRSAEWYKLLYHNAVLMLYRPSPCLCDASRNNDTLQKIFESSREAINLYASLHRSKRMNYSWITMHAVFNAGLSHIYALRNHLQSLQMPDAGGMGYARLEPNPTINQVINDTRACSKMLLAVSERWDAAKNCSDLFDKLSDAVLSDLIEIQSRKAQQPAGHDGNVYARSDGHGAQGGAVVTQSLPQFPETATGAYGDSSGFEYLHMAVDDTFRDCFGDLQGLALDEYRNDALSQLSQEWFLGLGGEDISMGRGI